MNIANTSKDKRRLRNHSDLGNCHATSRIRTSERGDETNYWSQRQRKDQRFKADWAQDPGGEAPMSV
jgi:hypothetical protein